MSNALPDYIILALGKIVVGEGLPQSDPHFDEEVFSMWLTMTKALEELGKYPQTFRYRSRPLKANPATLVPKSQPSLFFVYIVEELRETLRYIQLTFAYRLQTVVEDIVEDVKAARLTSLASPTRSLMELCAALEDVRRKEAPVLGDVLGLRPRDVARTLALASGESGPAGQTTEADKQGLEVVRKVFGALKPAREFMAFMKSDVLLDHWYGKGREMKLPKPTNILTLIDKRLSFSKAAKFSPRYHYEFLSEMAHPNMLSFSLLTAGVRKDSDGLEVTQVEAPPCQ